MYFILRMLVIFAPLSAISSALAIPNGQTSAYWIWGNTVPENVRFSKNLYTYQGVFDVVGNRKIYRFEGLTPRLIDGYAGRLILTYRLESLVPPEMVVSRFIAHRQAWKRHGVFVDGIQIDYDSPTAKLREYADWLVLLKNAVGNGTPISITGLGDWLASSSPSHLKELSSKVSFIAFMMYHGSQPLKRLDNYTFRLARLSLPFKLGRLQTQSYAKEFESVHLAPGYQGEIIFVFSEGSGE